MSNTASKVCAWSWTETFGTCCSSSRIALGTVAGGFAYGFHAEPRGTKDLYVWVASDLENAEAVYQALAEYGAPISEMSPAGFSDGKSLLQIGLPPNRIHIMQTIAGIRFEDAWPNRNEVVLSNGLTFTVIFLHDLIQNKAAVGRPQDKLDVRNLRKLVKSMREGGR